MGTIYKVNYIYFTQRVYSNGALRYHLMAETETAGAIMLRHRLVLTDEEYESVKKFGKFYR